MPSCAGGVRQAADELRAEAERWRLEAAQRTANPRGTCYLLVLRIRRAKRPESDHVWAALSSGGIRAFEIRICLSPRPFPY